MPSLKSAFISTLRMVPLILTIALTSCGGNVRLNHASEPILRQHLKVAVINVKVDVREEGLLKDAMDMARSQMKMSSGTESASQIEEYIISNINRNLLERGFLPVQRSQIKTILNEQRFQQTGLTDDVTKIGQLVKADAVFQGTIVARKKAGLDVPFVVACLFPPLFIVRGGDTQLLFSGNLTSVETGTIILSGTNSTNSGSHSLEDFDTLVNDWFDEVPELR